MKECITGYCVFCGTPCIVTGSDLSEHAANIRATAQCSCEGAESARNAALVLRQVYDVCQGDEETGFRTVKDYTAAILRNMVQETEILGFTVDLRDGTRIKMARGTSSTILKRERKQQRIAGKHDDMSVSELSQILDGMIPKSGGTLHESEDKAE